MAYVVMALCSYGLQVASRPGSLWSGIGVLVMAYVVMTYRVMACVVVAQIVMVCIKMACVVMAH